jgi:hypothetical protein
MTDDDLFATFERLADEARHPTLTLDLFTTEPVDDSDRPVDEPDDAVIRPALALGPPLCRLRVTAVVH